MARKISKRLQTRQGYKLLSWLAQRAEGVLYAAQLAEWPSVRMVAGCYAVAPLDVAEAVLVLRDDPDYASQRYHFALDVTGPGE